MSAQSSFDAGKALVDALNNAVAFIMALGLNNAFQKTFELIPIGKKKILGAWIYAILALGLGILLLWVFSTYLAPAIEHPQP
jgi:hypothetical protein